MTEDTVTRSSPDIAVPESGTSVRWDLLALRKHFGHSYEIVSIGMTLYALPHDGHLTCAIKADNGEGLRRKMIADLRIPRPRMAARRQEQ